MAKRIQLRRAKGWRKPPGAISVARPGRYGNPFPVEVYGQEKAVDLFSRWLGGSMSMEELSRLSTFETGSMVRARQAILNDLILLRGHDLACWCQRDQPCHADVLLRLANAPKGSDVA